MPAARVVLRPEPAAVRLGEAARDREPEPGARARPLPRRNGWKSASRCSSGRPAPRVDDVDPQLGGARLRPDAAPASRAASSWSAFSRRFASTRSIWAASTSTGGVSEPISSRTRAASAPSPASAWPTSSSTCHSSRCGSAAPASSRERSSSCSTTRSRRVASARIVSARPSRSSAASVRPGLASASAEARIAVSGERRSWDTERSKRRLERVAPPQRLRLERLLREPLAFLRQLPQRDERRLRLLGPPPRPARELADDDRGDDEDEQREPVLRVLDRERVERRDEEEVEREHAPERRRRSRSRPPRDRDRDDREQVEHRQAEHGTCAAGARSRRDERESRDKPLPG